ncbi:cyclophilin-type peptidyl-prolyl cis-trans isomerase, putative [Trypanosoma brucei brucei TREU927]|uniref:Peptidyl-prolyl cis-trans isomerase n=1 Tax=Trypanosoma brucei brucei (strain 927/4 GUTat10.1) TaxID=185431 RepID=Q585A7_TRYB2|nr:cyclophilin-type peptidyl-prolyl cis-trans isomerase, putative [Trypanosoma brucei brucei TREU927]AAX80395.1 cyclophilin-type peptidyl-prolyl cis-trans isomerase, putative [Trypanosoma brucei]AAZ11703.1 cyclophilin-type peptidyl-prolyl cis-trans isomerase, putative [Trypanosoma brucei brucei TREU927]
MSTTKLEGVRHSRRKKGDSRLQRPENDEDSATLQSRYDDVEERRLKEWENYQRSHRMKEEQNSCRAFLDMSIDDVLSGRLVFELFDDVVPRTVENFRALITGSCGIDTNTGVKLDYLGTQVHHVDHNNNIIVLGELDSFNLSSTGTPIADEGYRHRHTERGLLTMISEGPHTSGSVFGITLGPSPSLDFKQVVFGRAIDDLSLLEKLEAVPLDDVGRPVLPVTVSFCGALTGEKPPGRQQVPAAADDSASSEHVSCAGEE